MNFCAEESFEAEEQLFGTAKQVDRWLLIEHAGRWERKAEDSLPVNAQQAVEGLKVRFPGIRLALIRQDGPATRPLSGFVAFSSETKSELFPFSLDRHEDLESRNFDRILQSPASPRGLILVCTHGTHDRCCAKFGNSVFETMRRASGDGKNVWRVSHIGGCRFAPNVVSLPTGIVYGRVRESDCQAIVNATDASRVIPRLLRGRSCYARPAQAAEYFLRSELNETGELQLMHLTDGRNHDWNVVFRRGGDRISLRLAEEEAAAIFTLKSCSALERSPRPKFRLTDYKIEQI